MSGTISRQDDSNCGHRLTSKRSMNSLMATLSPVRYFAPVILELRVLILLLVLTRRSDLGKRCLKTGRCHAERCCPDYPAADLEVLKFRMKLKDREVLACNINEKQTKTGNVDVDCLYCVCCIQVVSQWLAAIGISGPKLRRSNLRAAKVNTSWIPYITFISSTSLRSSIF